MMLVRRPTAGGEDKQQGTDRLKARGEEMRMEYQDVGRAKCKGMTNKTATTPLQPAGDSLIQSSRCLCGGQTRVSDPHVR